MLRTRQVLKKKESFNVGMHVYGGTFTWGAFVQEGVCAHVCTSQKEQL